MTTHEQVLVVVASLWPSPAWPPEAQAVFLADIREFEAAQVLAAVRRFYQRDPQGFRPTPGKLRALIEAPKAEGAERAWQAFLRAVAHYTGKPTAETVTMPNFADPLVSQTVEALGGFRQYLGGIPTDQLDYLHSKFLKAYKRVASGDNESLRLGDGHVPELSGRGEGPASIRKLLGGM
jgi:hypothetical protein